MAHVQVWQLGAGEANRFYDDIFVEHDVMFMGPGRFDAFEMSKYLASGWSKAAVHSLDRFCNQVRAGDIVVARRGLRAVAIGVVANEDYEHNEAFGDMFGWDLHHTRRVIWQDQLSDEIREMQEVQPLFASRKQIPTFTRLNDQPILEVIRGLIQKVGPRDLRPLPSQNSSLLEIEEIGQKLFSKGLANDAVDKVVLAITRQRRLLTWYNSPGHSGGRPTEHEVVAHMVLPILLALGWSEQLLAIEWNKIDLAIFDRTPTNKETCALVCEAKTAGHGLQGAVEQAKRYVKNLQLTNCEKILVTEGGRFYLYEQSGGDWGLIGYLNVEQVREKYAFPRGTGGIDTLVALTPAGILRR